MKTQWERYYEEAIWLYPNKSVDYWEWYADTKDQADTDYCKSHDC